MTTGAGAGGFVLTGNWIPPEENAKTDAAGGDAAAAGTEAGAETEVEAGAGHARARADRESGEEARELSGDGAEPNKKAKK